MSAAVLGTSLIGLGTLQANASTDSGVKASSVSRRCDSEGQVSYKFGKAHKAWKTTNVHSDWAKPGVHISYAKTKTGSTTVAGTAGISAEAGIILAKASTHFDLTLSHTWTHSDTWTYDATVHKKKGKTKGRLMMYHNARKFSTTKYKLATDPQTRGCKQVKVWTKTITAPLKKNSNLWGIQYS